MKIYVKFLSSLHSNNHKVNYFNMNSIYLKNLEKETNKSLPTISKYFIPFTWFAFLASLAYIIYFFPNLPKLQFNNTFEINGLTIVIWLVVTFFSAIVQTYSANYMKGFKKQNTFLILCLLFSMSVMFFVASNHIVLLLVSWLSMGVIMSRLIGINSEWKEAKEASFYAIKNYFPYRYYRYLIYF